MICSFVDELGYGLDCSGIMTNWVGYALEM